MASALDEFEDGNWLVLQEHRRLASLDPNHELLKYGDVRQKDQMFYIADEHRADHTKRFARGGVHPRGARACAYAMGQHYVALKKVADDIEGMVPPPEKSPQDLPSSSLFPF